ncbi:hypothetical protein K402DRAFT_467387 [Aulographum hederae CBS 113979]|uniref:CsbD-like domain-containing protein n=1 Tax=Aulographum hederae CBS 113979 TaxID=1176131 RepID=A0A6G1GKZ3_9PEZI|nr:hypothetical protein K402DRAFT_467387 [Aulographum hederae CBS 113979]
MSGNNSTLGAAVEQAKGVVNDAVAYVTGSSADQAKANEHKSKAQLEDEASHATVKVPGATISTSGVSKDDPARSEGSWNQTMGSAKEAVGGLLGSENLKQAGAQQNQQGKEQEAEGLIQDYGDGIKGRVGGAVGGAVAGILGDKDEEARMKEKHDQAKTAQRGVEADLIKKADAEAARQEKA